MSSQPNQSLSDGLACLTAVAAAAEPVAGRELARRLGLHHAKVNRLLMTLAELGLVRQDERRRYTTAGGLHVLAALAGHGSGLLKRLQPVLSALHAEWPFATLAVGVLWQDRVAYTYHAGPGAQAVDALRVPGLYPAAESSIGVVLTEAGPPRRHAALVHQGDASRHRSVAVPLFEDGQAVAGLAATGIPLTRRPQAVANRLFKATAVVGMQPPGEPD